MKTDNLSSDPVTANSVNTVLAPVFIPSFEEYQKAKEITIAYENEQNRLEKIRLEEFRKDLSSLFLNNNHVIIKDFNLVKEYNRYDIIPTDPYLEEMYEGELNSDIDILCNKHNIKASIIYWCYHK
jgi:hypothetical protein